VKYYINRIETQLNEYYDFCDDTKIKNLINHPRHKDTDELVEIVEIEKEQYEILSHLKKSEKWKMLYEMTDKYYKKAVN